jgi:hypothetical protein
MNLYKTVFFVVFSFALFAQEKPTNNFKRFQLGINFSPDACFRMLENTNASSTSDELISLRNDMEIVKFGYTTGLNFQYNLNPIIALELGAHFSNKGYQMKKQDLVPPTSQPDPSLPEQFKFVQNFQTIDLPLGVNFTLGKNNLRFITCVGAAANFLVKESQTTVLYYSDRTDKKNIPNTYDYKKFNVTPFLSLGIDYRINQNMNIRIEPTIRYGIMKIIEAPITAYLFNAGFNVGYYYNF